MPYLVTKSVWYVFNYYLKTYILSLIIYMFYYLLPLIGLIYSCSLDNEVIRNEGPHLLPILRSILNYTEKGTNDSHQIPF